MHERKTRMEYTPDLDALAHKERVCAYARVSSDRDEAFHSLSAQISYYQKKTAEHPDWEFAGVFSDRGITGTKENRPGFQAMLEACRKGEIDIVLAKSITRFARNTVILLETVREFRGLGIDIFTVCSPDRHDKQRLRNSHLNGGFLEHSITYSVVLLPGLVQRGNRNTRFLRLLFGQQKICRRFSSIESGECVKSWPILHEDRIV